MRSLILCFLFTLVVGGLPTPAAAQNTNSEQLLRGAMVPTFVTKADLRDLAALGANSVRWQLAWDGFPSFRASSEPLSSYAAWLETTLQHVDTMLPHCRALGLQIVLDLHTPPGGQTSDGKWRLFQRDDHQQFFVDTWRGIAERYRGDSTFWAFDLMNEPNENGRVADNARSWRDLAEVAGRAIRAVDPRRRLVIEAAPNGDSRALADFAPLPLANVVYSFHMYDPVDFTHQGLGNDTAMRPYPGKYYGSRWDRGRLRRWLQPVRDWQTLYQVPIYIGEFSAVRWAPGAYQYLRDCIRLYERYDWHWTYHAWRESHVWSVEHGTDRNNSQPVAGDTDRKELLRKYFQRSR